MGSTPERPTKPAAWIASLPHQRCNYHPTRPATMAFVGTPLCAACAERLRAAERSG
jgi:hypothetical protein